jgi:fructose-1,6-bisphosphatase/inositol monophosphatase family enzyme
MRGPDLEVARCKLAVTTVSDPLAHIGLPELHAVTALIEQVARTVVMPRFGSLTAGEVEQKSTPGYLDDLVTIVDREAEASLTEGLCAIVGAEVIGEEAAHERPDALAGLKSAGPLWIVDPLDGTRNFAGGNDAFGTMVAFALDGTVQASWIVLPARGESFAATRGGGSLRNGRPVRVPAESPAGPLRGTFLTRFMPNDRRDAVRALTGADFIQCGSGAAAVEYTDVLSGRTDFVVYYRLLPWDHGAPALVLTEAGGTVTHLDGRPYTLQSSDQVTIVARTVEIAERVRRWFR